MSTPDNNKEGQDKDFPGYPHYPAREDIAAPDNNNGIVSIDAEKTAPTNERENEDIVMGTEADVTEEDLNLLDSIDGGSEFNGVKNILDSIDEDGEPLNENNTTDGLDVPGSELDDANEEIGAEDEENNYYSLGSDNNDSLEESEDR